MGGDGDWIKIIIFALLFALPVLKAIINAFSGRKPAQNFDPRDREGGVKPAQRRIHEVLEEMRRDFEGDAPAAREDERGIAESSEPAMRGSLDPLDTPRQVSERQVVERPFLERPAPERPRVERPLPQTRRPARPIESARAQRPVQRARREPARQPAPTPERHFTELVHFESTPFRGIERLESVEFEQLHGLDPYAIPESDESRDPPPTATILGMSARQLIVAHVILGPPRCFDRR